MATGGDDALQVRQVIAVLVIAHFFLQHFAVADDGIQWSAELMTHVREEVALGAAGLERGVAGVTEIAMRFREFGRTFFDLALERLFRFSESFVRLPRRFERVGQPYIRLPDREHAQDRSHHHRERGETLPQHIRRAGERQRRIDHRGNGANYQDPRSDVKEAQQMPVAHKRHREHNRQNAKDRGECPERRCEDRHREHRAPDRQCQRRRSLRDSTAARVIEREPLNHERRHYRRRENQQRRIAVVPVQGEYRGNRDRGRRLIETDELAQ
jgi:hypothetical protein